ncbi:MAG: UDP-N-acetylmuramoyl-tripeptide--D-alanyl-D-alanine ligase [candidate division WOR-3 bacterium]
MEPVRIDEVVMATAGSLTAGKPELVITGVGVDSRSINPGELFIAIKGKRMNGHQFVADAVRRGAAAILVSEPVALPADAPVAVVQVADTREALLDLARWYRSRLKPRVVAITGSNGKTTTKELLAGLLQSRFTVVKARGSYNNDIGVPLTVLAMDHNTQIGIFEIEMNELGGTKKLARVCQPEIGIITNVGDTHLEYMGDRTGVAQEKNELVEMLPETGLAILNYDDSLVRKMSRAGCRTRTFGLNPEADVFAFNIQDFGLSGTQFQLLEKYPIHLSFPGKHNISNFLAAAAAANELGLSWQEISQNARMLTLPTQRLTVKNLSAVTLIDDSFNANPQSMQAALEVLANSTAREFRLAVLGDMLELGSRSAELHRQVGEIAGRIIDRLITVGTLAQLISEGAETAGLPADRIRHYHSSGEVGRELFDFIKPGDTILVKGSRAMAMERITQLIVRFYGEKTD